jgi:hypothetical protein
VFTTGDADQLIATLDHVLGETIGYRRPEDDA